MKFAVCRIAIVAAFFGCLNGCGREAPAALGQAPAARDASFPAPIVELRGSGEKIGDEYAHQLGGDVQLLHDKYLMKWFQDPGPRFLALGAAVAFEEKLEPAHRAEIHALADALHMDEREAMLANCFLDLAPMAACSTIALPRAASEDGVARLGRNLDFPSLDVADKHSVLLIYHPEGRYAFAAVSWPGLIGVLSGMNEHGLTLANMEVARPSRFPVALPYTMLYRTVLERCRTVNEAVHLLQTTPRQTANNLMLMDASGDRAVAEITPDGVVVRRADDRSALISTNHQRGPNADGAEYKAGLCDRYDLLHATAAEHFGKIDERAVEQLLAQVDVRMTLQAMVFEPETRTLYLATGTNAATHAFHRLDLKSYFAQTAK